MSILLFIMNKFFITFGLVLCSAHGLYAPKKPIKARSISELPPPRQLNLEEIGRDEAATHNMLIEQKAAPKIPRYRPDFGDKSLQKRSKSATIVFKWSIPEEHKTNNALDQLLNDINPEDNECCSACDLRLSNLTANRNLLVTFQKLLVTFPALETVYMDSTTLCHQGGGLSKSGLRLRKFLQSHGVELLSDITDMIPEVPA